MPLQGVAALKNAIAGHAPMQDAKTYRASLAVLLAICHAPSGPLQQLLAPQAVPVVQAAIHAATIVVRIACLTAVAEDDLLRLRSAVQWYVIW